MCDYLKERALVTMNCIQHEPEHIQTGSCEIAALYPPAPPPQKKSSCVCPFVYLKRQLAPCSIIWYIMSVIL